MGEVDKIAELYYRSNSVKFGAFKLSAHISNPDLPLSPYYLHYPKPGEPGSELLPELHGLIGHEFFRICQSQDPIIEPQHIASVPEGADPLADAFAKEYPNYPANLLRFTKLKVANRTTFLGPRGSFSRGDETVIVDDHTSGGANKRLILATANAAGLVVPTILSAVDRMQGAEDNLAMLGVRFFAILTIEELFQKGVEQGYITQQQADEASEYRVANQL